ncbi:retrovirus-related pol polyprotein from transposon TNT 1-94 [Tanacetum coccineum]
MESARTMLIFAKAPLFLWAEAVATACYTLNRSLVHTLHGKTYYELLKGKKPNLQYFRVFGSLNRLPQRRTENEVSMVSQPDGICRIQRHPSHVYRLKKALYGLKQAPRAWYDKLSAFLLKSGFTKGVSINLPPTPSHTLFEKAGKTSSTDVDDGTNVFLSRITSFTKSQRHFYLTNPNMSGNLEKSLVLPPAHPIETPQWRSVTKLDEEIDLLAGHPKSRKVPPSPLQKLNTSPIRMLCHILWMRISTAEGLWIAFTKFRLPSTLKYYSVLSWTSGLERRTLGNRIFRCCFPTVSLILRNRGSYKWTRTKKLRSLEDSRQKSSSKDNGRELSEEGKSYSSHASLPWDLEGHWHEAFFEIFSATTITLQTCVITAQGTKMELEMVSVAALGSTAASLEFLRREFLNEDIRLKLRKLKRKPKSVVGHISAIVTRNPSANGWYLDSGATVHVCDSRDKFVDYQKVTGKQVIMANSDKDDVCGFGTVKLKFLCSKVVTCKMCSMLLPQIPKCFIIGKGSFWDGMYTRYLYVYLLRSKDKAFDSFKVYKAEVENQLGKKIKILRSGRGGEYFTGMFDAFCEENVEGTQKKATKEVIFTINIDDDPKTFSEAMSSCDAPMWKEAINDEIDSILGNQTWELAELPKGVRPKGSKWVFKKKLNPDGSISAFKARLVAKGYMQKEGIDYFDMYAPVARISSIRTLIAISAVKGLYIHQMDVKMAFLNGYLNEDVCMEQPKGFVIQGQENKVCRLVKSLYGLKQAPKQWHERFDTTVTSFGFQHSSADRCIYTRSTKDYTVVICLYVDDMLIIGTTLDGILETKSYLSSKFKMKDLGEVDTILGVKECNTPFDTSVKLEVNSGRAVAQLEYASVIGSLMYAMHYTRPDIAFDVSKLSQYTRALEGYLDASWINHFGDSKSTSGWIYTLAGGAVSWASRKQTCIYHSTMEAEFISLAAAGKEAEWIWDLLMDIQLWLGPMPSILMYCDSKAALSIAYNSVYNGKSRHLRLRHNYIPLNHVDDVPVVEPNQHDDVLVVPEPILEDEDEDLEEDEFEEE